MLISEFVLAIYVSCSRSYRCLGVNGGFEEILVRTVVCRYDDVKRVVIDGNTITSRGPGTSLEFALAIVELAKGKELRDKLASGMLLLTA